jgi:hypothetical protein
VKKKKNLCNFAPIFAEFEKFDKNLFFWKINEKLENDDLCRQIKNKFEME